MANEKKISRRTVLKVIAVGVGTASTLPILENDVLGQHKHPDMQTGPSPGPFDPGDRRVGFFNALEKETVASISDLIIPTDEHSPGARAAGVSGFIDLMVSESLNEIKTLWRDRLARVYTIRESPVSRPFLLPALVQPKSHLKTTTKNQ